MRQGEGHAFMNDSYTMDITAGRVAISAALSEVVLPLCQCYHVDGKGL